MTLKQALFRQAVGFFLAGVAFGYGLGRHTLLRRTAPLKVYWNDAARIQYNAAALRREQDKRRNGSITQLRK